MKVSIAIMAHPRRKRYVAELLAMLPGAVVVWDEKNIRWDTGRRSMLAFDPDADWHLVVQDDALLCRGFIRQVHAALAEVEGGPVAFYCGKTGKFGSVLSKDVMRNASRSGQHFFKAPGPWWGPAVAIKPQDIPAMIEWCDPRDDVPNYDRRMSRYFESIGRLCWYSVPCLVEHRTGANDPSLVPGRGISAGRTAAIWMQDGRKEWMESNDDVPFLEGHQAPVHRNYPATYTPLRKRPPGRPTRPF